MLPFLHEVRRAEDDRAPGLEQGTHGPADPRFPRAHFSGADRAVAVLIRVGERRCDIALSGKQRLSKAREDVLGLLKILWRKAGDELCGGRSAQGVRKLLQEI